MTLVGSELLDEYNFYTIVSSLFQIEQIKQSDEAAIKETLYKMCCRRKNVRNRLEHLETLRFDKKSKAKKK